MRIDRTYRWLIAFFLLTGSSSPARPGSKQSIGSAGNRLGLKGSVYHIARVEDERRKPEMPVVYPAAVPSNRFASKQDLAKDLLPYVQTCTAADTSKVALVLAFEKFQLKETAQDRRNIHSNFRCASIAMSMASAFKSLPGRRNPPYVVHGPIPESTTN